MTISVPRKAFVAGVQPGDADAKFLAGIRRIADEVAAKHAGDVDSTRASRKESIDALKEIGALSAFVSTELGGAESRSGARGSLLRARQALRRERDGLRDAPDPGRDARPPCGEQPFFKDLSAPPRRRAAAGRFGHLRGRDRRRHGQLGRRA